MEYPIYIEGQQRGSLKSSQAGLYTLLEAELPGLQEGLYRLWLHGGGECSYFGLLQPWSGGMYLRRRLSRTELARLPGHIDYASDRAAAVEKAPPAPSLPSRAEPPAEAGLEWLSRPDGSLVAFEGQDTLLALPARLRRAVPGVDIRRIAGRDYMVFRY